LPTRIVLIEEALDGGIPFGHIPLNLDGATQHVHDAGELDQHAISGGVDDTAAMSAMAGSRSVSGRIELRQLPSSSRSIKRL
jgi:hypothetical protein